MIEYTIYFILLIIALLIIALCYIYYNIGKNEGYIKGKKDVNKLNKEITDDVDDFIDDVDDLMETVKELIKLKKGESYD